MVETTRLTKVERERGSELLKQLREAEMSSDLGGNADDVREVIDSLTDILRPGRVLSFSAEEKGDKADDTGRSEGDASLSSSMANVVLTSDSADTRDSEVGSSGESVYTSGGAEVHGIRSSEAQRNVGVMLNASGKIPNADEVRIIQKHDKHGNFGQISEGIFRGVSVIVKKFDEKSPDAIKFFTKEVMLLDEARGNYACQLMAWCTEPLMLVTVRYPRTLEEGVVGPNALSLDERVRVAYQVGVCLKNMHSRGILHNDLKLANVFLDEFNNARLGDFGQACKADSEDLRDSRNRGNLMYRPPEVLRGELPTFKSDVYSFGLLVYEIFFGEPYFARRFRNEAKSFVDYVTNPKNVLIPATEVYWMENQEDTTKLCKGFWDVIMRCWSHDPERRPTIDQVVEAIAKYGVRSAIPRSSTAENFWHKCCVDRECTSKDQAEERTYKDRVEVAQVVRNAVFVPDANIEFVLRNVCKTSGFITIREFWELNCWFPNWFREPSTQIEMGRAFEQKWFALTKDEGQRRLGEVHRGRYFLIFPNQVRDMSFRYPFTLYISEDGKREENRIVRQRNTVPGGSGFVLACSPAAGLKFVDLPALADYFIHTQRYYIPPFIDTQYAEML